MLQEMCLCLEAKDTNHALTSTFSVFYHGIDEIRNNKHIVIKIVMIQKQALICFTDILLQIPQCSSCGKPCVSAGTHILI